MAIYHPPETIDEILEMDKLEYMENQNPLREDELKDPHRVIKIELLGIIATYQDPVCCNRIFRDFEEMNGYPLDPHAYGFKSFTSMMRTFSDKFTSYQDGLKTTYSAKPTERSGHLQELIRNQVTIEEKRRRDMRRSRSYGRNGRRSNYGAGIFYAQNFVPLLTDDRTLEQRTADNLASFGRSLAEHAGMGGLDWGGRRSRIDEEESDESDDAGGLILRSRSAPPRPPPMIDEKIEKIGVNVHDEPKNASEDCTNPFRTQNNVRIRDIVIQHGESDDMGRRGMGLVDVAVRFRKEYRLPLGGIPNLTEERIMQKMQAVETVEWIVEKMGDGHAYVIVPVETIKKAKEVGPGCRSDAPPADKPKSTGVSPAAKRMFGFALKSALNNNDRMEGTRERVIKERLQTEEMYDGEILCDSDGDPVMSTIPVQREKKIEKVEEKKEETTRSFDRETMMVLNDKVSLDPKVAGLASVYRILRTQPTTHPVGGRPSPSSSNSSLASNRGRTFAPLNGASSRFSPPNTSSSMSFGSSSFGGGPSTGAPSFGTFRSAPPTASLGAADKDDSDSDIIQPVQSSLASKLPQSTFASKENEDSGYSELLEAADEHRPMDCDLRRQMRQHLGLAEEDDVIIEEEYVKKEYSPPVFPPGLAPMSAPPGILTRPPFPPFPMQCPIPPPLTPGGCWVVAPAPPMMYMPSHVNTPPPSPFYPPPGPPIGFFPPPGIFLPPPGIVIAPPPPPGIFLPPGLPPLARLMPGPPPGLWSTPPPLVHPPGLPTPDKEHPVEFKGEVYYGTPEVWPPPIKKEKERKAERREKIVLPIRAPDDPSSPATSGFVSSMVSSPASGQTVMFGTKNQAVPSSAPAATRPAVSFAPSPAAAPVSAFGGLKISQSPSFGGAAAPPQRKMVEVIEDESEKKSESKGGAELLGETIQLIGKLRSGIVVYLKQIEGTPVEDVVAGNPDFFDIDEKDERIHLLHTDVDPKLLMVDGRELGEMAGVAEEKKKVEEPPKEVKPITTAFSRPVPTFGGMVAPSFGGSRPTFGGVSRPVKVADDETDGRPTATLSATTSGNEQAKPRPGVPTFGGANRKVEEVKSVSSSFGAQPAVERAAPSAVSTEPAKPQPGMPSFGTKSLHVPERPDSALSTRSEKEPEKVRAAPTFTRPVEKKAEPVVAPPPPVVERPQSVMSDSTSTSDSTVESTQGSKYRTAESDFSGHKSESVCDSSGPSAQEEDEEVSDDEAGENGRGPFAFPRHRDIRRLTKKPSLLFDNVYKGSLHIASILTSMEPNRLVMTVHEGNMMMKVQLFMNELRSAYADQAPLSAENVKLGQFAVAINGEVIVRVVVLRYLEEANEFVCACLDINALIEVAAQNLYPLLEQFNVHAHRASTFIARICGLHALGERGHKAMELVVKPDEDPSFKLPCPFVLHGKDEVTGELLVDVAVVIANEAVWLGESLAPLIGQKGYKHDKFMNPGIDHAVMFAVKYGLAGYEISEKKEERKAVDLDEESESDTLNERDLCTLRSDSLENVQELVTSCGVQYKFSPTNRKKAEEKEEGELDSSRDDSTASERTTVERHAAGDFGRDVKAEELQEDEFVVVAASPSKPVVDVESVTTLIRLFNDKGEHVSADVIKALCRALILSANNTLSSLGERGALIANAEALEAIDMA